MSIRAKIGSLLRWRLYDPARHGLYEHGRQLLVPAGQSVHDPAVFGRFDRATQTVVPLEDAASIYDVRFDELMVEAQDHARLAPDAVVRDRYRLVLPLLAPGSGLLLDACTTNDVPEIRSTVEGLGYTYEPVDIEGGDVRREDVTALTYADASVARIISLDTLEHVPSYEAALREFARVLERGGVLIVHVPAYFVDREQSAPLDPANDPWEHVRYFSARELVENVRRAGLAVLRAQFHLDYGAAVVVAGKP